MGDFNTIKQHFSKLKQYEIGQRQLQVAQIRQKENLDTVLHKLYADQIAGTLSREQVRENLAVELHKFGMQAENLSKNEANILCERAKLEAQIYEACRFDTKMLTKDIAHKLTKSTNYTWLPIRFLLRQGTDKIWPREAYGVVQAEALLNIPNIADTITLLHTPYYVCPARYNITHTEKEFPNLTIYENVDAKAMNYIWDLGSYSFISIADGREYNAIFDLNRTHDKPFLHLPLNKETQQILRTFPPQYKLYSNYKVPSIPANHPRAIATKHIAKQVNERLNTLHADHTPELQG